MAAVRNVVKAEPYLWPIRGELLPERTALLVIDMQHDFCSKGGHIDKMGFDIAPLRKPIQPIRNVLDVMRSIPGFTIIHIRQGHRPDLSDCPENKLLRTQACNSGIGDRGPLGRILVRGEPGWDFIDELQPLPSEIIVEKPGKGSFYATDLDLILRNRDIKLLILCGVSTGVCVHTTLREANDRGYECLLLEDCCSAASAEIHEAAVKMVKMQGGVFGAVSCSTNLLVTLEQLKNKPARPSSTALLAVNGTLMRGLQLNANLIDVGATFQCEAQTEPSYRIWSINDVHPAAVRVTSGGSAMAVEVWEVPSSGLASILQKEPPGLSIGKMRLADGREVLGVLGEPALCEGMKEITQFGGWRNYIDSNK